MSAKVGHDAAGERKGIDGGCFDHEAEKLADPFPPEFLAIDERRSTKQTSPQPDACRHHRRPLIPCADSRTGMSDTSNKSHPNSQPRSTVSFKTPLPSSHHDSTKRTYWMT